MFGLNSEISYDQALKLKKRNFDINAKYVYIKNFDRTFLGSYKKYQNRLLEEDCKAYSITELLQVLPAFIEKDNVTYFLTCDGHHRTGYRKENSEEMLINIFHCTILDSIFDLLIWCLDNNFIKNV